MEPPVDILFFGDQTGDYSNVFRDILAVKEDVLLKALLDQTHVTLREEISHQSASVQKNTPASSSINDMVNRYAEQGTPKSCALESALTCVSQLACFFRYQSTNIDGYPSPARTRTVGSCTGLLAAVAISSCCSLLDLLDVAVDIVKIAYRIGTLVSEAATEIERSPAKSPSWSMIVPNMRPEEAKEVLDRLHQVEGIPPCSYAYISAVANNGVTISGPHRVLDQLTQTPECQKLRGARLSIHGPYHAPHLFDDLDLEGLLANISSNTLDKHELRLPLSSTSDSNWRSTETLRQALCLVVNDILVHPLRWDQVIENVASMVHDRGDFHCNVIELGPSKVKNSLLSALKAKNLDATLDERFVRGFEPKNELKGSNPSQPKIAICGLSGRFPNAADHEAFWKLLEQGLDLHREIPKDRFDVKTHVDQEGKRNNTSHTPFGCFIDEPGLFDPKFFNMSPREALQTDPMHRLALVTAYEALEMSGYVGDRTPSTKLHRVGTFYGQTSDDWREIQAAQKVDTYFIPGGVRAFAPGRINYFFKFSGPSFSIDTACSSSLAAINLACTSLWARDCDTALAGGMNVLTNPDIFSGLSRGQFLSKKGPCATFDNDADGYCRGDGVGSVVLKRLEDAEADRDPVLAVILGAGTNHSAEAVSITHPHSGAQEFLFKKVLNNAGVDPLDISYVEMHGTGTQAGDTIEMESVLSTFAPDHRQRTKDQSLHLGAVKANAGHGEAASGITALIKVLTMLDKSIIPPHCGIKGTINRTFPKNLDERNVNIPFKRKPWPRPEGGKRRLFLNNFSAAGGNTALLLEDGDIRPQPQGDDRRSTHVVAVTAKTKSSLKKNVENLLAFLEQRPQVNLPSLSYTTTARRIQHNFRITTSGSDIDKIKETFKSALSKDVRPIPRASPKVCVMFTGQGSHYVSMAKQLYHVSTQFRNDILKFDKSAKMQGFPSILPLIDGSAPELADLPPLIVQLGATCVQMALMRMYKSWGIEATVVVGHSLGEYAALNAAGVLSATDTIFLCGSRAKLMQNKCESGTHSMLAVRASISSLGDYLNHEGCEIACINAPEQTVISGSNTAIGKLAEELKEAGFKADRLPIPYAFHSAQVDPILGEFEASTRGVNFNKPMVPVISPLLNNVVLESHEPAFNASYMRDHCRKTVNFLGGIEAARHAGLVDDGTVWLEIGAHPICTGMVKATLGQKIKFATSMRRNEDDWKTIADSMCTLNDAGLKIDWNRYHAEYSSSHVLVKLPTYSWDNQNYWIQYTNDWTLAKGNADIEARTPKTLEFSSASVHRIAELDLDADKPRIVGECDLTESLLKEVIEGHEVNGFGLCPPSLYCDMAITIAKHLYKLLNPNKPNIGLNACSMKVEKPLIVAEHGPQLFHIEGTYSREANHVSFGFYTLDVEGKRTTLHAACGVKYENAADWQQMWARQAYMIRTQIDRLISGVSDGDNDLIKRGMAYKLFASLIHYGHKYRGMEEVVLDNEALEGTASVRFQTGGTDDAFLCSPYRTDSVAHLSGFIMLGNRNAETNKEVFVSHGWENYRVAKPLECGKQYRSYVRMQKEGTQTVVGDLYVLHGEDVVGVVEGLRFNRMPRQLMDSLLAAGARKPKAMPKATIAAPEPKAQHVTSSTTPAVTNPAPAKPAFTGITSKALEIIAEEVGVSVSDLSNESSFADLGVDSLLSLNITGKFRESCELDVQSTIFVDYPTVEEFKAFLSHNHGGPIEEAAIASAPKSQTAPKGTPSDASDASSSSISNEGSPQPSSITSASDNEDPFERAGKAGIVKIIRDTVAEELDVEGSEIDASVDLSSMGLDSLMSLSVLGKLREATGHDLPSNFFATNPTFTDIEKEMLANGTEGVISKPTNTKNRNSAASATDVSNDASRNLIDHSTRPPAPKQLTSTNSNPLPSATSVLLECTPNASAPTLFLFPDGSGSATSYSLLSPLHNHNVYALNSPFLHAAHLYTSAIGIPGLVSLYITELTRRQPHGPYNLAGWSAGGLCAYEATLQLLAKGERVERLILLDAPNPEVVREELPRGLHRWFDELGILGEEGRKTPEWLLPHFDASIAALGKYTLGKLYEQDVVDQVRVFALWARNGVCRKDGGQRPPKELVGETWSQSIKWLLEDRVGVMLEDGGWANWVGKGKIPLDRVVVMDANHFTMMKRTKIKEVGEFIGRCMDG